MTQNSRSTVSLHDDRLMEIVHTSLEHNGFVLLTDVYEPLELGSLREWCVQLERYAAESHPDTCSFRNGKLWAVVSVFELSPQLMRLALAPQFCWIAPAVVGEPVTFFGATLMKKEFGGIETVDWHQDNGISVERDLGDELSKGLRAGVPYRYGTSDVVSSCIEFRINIEQQFEDGGCLRVVPGSHKEPVMNKEDLLGRIDVEQSVLCPAPAGSILVFKPMLAHASGPNTRSADPDNHRRVVQVEFRPVSSRPLPDLGWYRWKNSARLETEGVSFPRPARE